jgi:hypothetical protein
LAADPAAFKAFSAEFDNLDTAQQQQFKERNDKIGLAATDLIPMSDQELPGGIMNTAQVFIDSGEPELAQQAAGLAELAKTDPSAARAQLQALQTQSRDVEKVIASQEKLRLELANQSQDELQSRLDAQKDKFGQVSELRKDVNSISKEFLKVRDANNRVEAIFDTNKQADIAADFAEKAKTNPKAVKDIAQSTEAFGDMALIFNFMKMLDPGSTVREGEFATAQNTGGAEEAILNLYNQAIKGTRLTDEQRAGIRNQATGLMKTAKNQNIKDTARLRRSAKRNGLPEDEIFIDETAEESPNTQQLTSKSGVQFTVTSN